MEGMETKAKHFKPEAKRKRVRKACDACRDRKIKCDGEQPCESCAHYVQECKYSKEGRPRYAGPAYAEELERKIDVLTFALQMIVPGIDIKSLLEIDLSQPLEVVSRALTNAREHEKLQPLQALEKRSKSPLRKEEDLLDTMIGATGRLEIDGRGGCDYQGDFAGLAFLDRITRHCSQFLNPDLDSEISSQLFPPRAFTQTGSGQASLQETTLKETPLPPKEVALRLTGIALTKGCCLLKFIHQPSFVASLHRLYDVSPENYVLEDEVFLPLLYMALAVGELYAKDSPRRETPALDPEGIKGAAYFRAGHALVDIIDCHDLSSLQTVVFMIIYFQSLGLMHSCYSHISIAIASAFRMGLHRSVVLKFFDPIQQEVRKRLFWVLQTMDTYVATMLGLPKNIRDEDLDQDMPLDVDDEYITKEGILPVPASHLSNMAVVNAHTKLLLIMAHVVHCIYPNQKDLSREYDSYQVDYTRIVKIEADLDEWFQVISQHPALHMSVPPEALQIQLLLRLAYAHVQMVLYRPFIQHLVRAKLQDVLEMKSYACASACVKAAMQIVWIVDEMDRRGLLIGAYWFTVYIIFFAIMSLCMFILGNANGPTTDETMKAALKGREILIRLSLESVSAARCVASLGNIFDRISPKFMNATLKTAVESNLDTNMDLTSDSTTGTTTPNISLDTGSVNYPHPAPGVYGASSAHRSLDYSPYPPHYHPSDGKAMMPLAAYSKGPGLTNPSFPVFDPALLDQASALQYPQHLEHQLKH